MIEVHWASGSCNSWCVLLALAVKRVPYASKLLQLSKREHKTAEYLALNPRGKVPCIRDGEFVLYESLAILTYLDRKYPDPPLYGETPAEAALIARLVAEDRFYLEPKLDALLIPFYRGKVAEIVEELPQKANAVHEELVRLEALLGQGDYLAGPRLSAADLTVFPHLQHLRRGLLRPDVQAHDLGSPSYAERYPRLEAWNARIEQIPGYELTYPPHWK
jgi:glutathione S-transferase